MLDGRRQPQAITRDLRRLTRCGIDLAEADGIGVDTGARMVWPAGGAILYTQLVITLGATVLAAGVPGLAAAGHNIYTLAGNVSTREALRDFDAGRVTVAVASLPYKCPAAP